MLLLHHRASWTVRSLLLLSALVLVHLLYGARRLVHRAIREPPAPEPLLAPPSTPPPAPPPAPAPRAGALPVVFVFITEEGLGPEHYQWLTVEAARAHGNCDVTLLTGAGVAPPPRLRGAVAVVDVAGLQSPTLDAFRAVYRPWGLAEPWERHNFERFLLLAAYMEREGLPVVFYADSDVALLAPVPPLDAGACDALLDLNDGDPARTQWETMFWAAWAGSGILPLGLLRDFAHFTIAMYAPEHLGHLEHKRSAAPFVCDMTLWYLFAATADPRLGAAWGVPASAALPALPDNRTWRLCDGLTLGFDHMHGHRSPPRPDRPLLSVHFQGGTKGDMAGFLQQQTPSSAPCPPP